MMDASYQSNSAKKIYSKPRLLFLLASSWIFHGLKESQPPITFLVDYVTLKLHCS